MRNDREHQEQVALFRWAELNKRKHPALALMFAIPNGGHRHIAVARKLKAEGVKAGVPDIFLPWPALQSRNACGLFVEMKAKGGKVSDSQAEWKDLLSEFYQVVVCWSWTEAAAAICEYLGIPESRP